MPTYEYKCTSCENRYETKEGFDAPSRQNCPRCGSVAKRVLFAPPIVFKGNGFYITDSRKGSSATIGADAVGAPTSGESKTESPAPTAAAPAEPKPAAAAASSDE